MVVLGVPQNNNNRLEGENEDKVGEKREKNTDWK